MELHFLTRLKTDKSQNDNKITKYYSKSGPDLISSLKK